MRYQNPIVRGMYPDPSVCRAGDKYYMVCSSMNYYPGVPLFESADMVNWKQIGHCLTRESQIDLSGAEIFSGIFAPTIRYNNGRFYMVTTNAVTHDNYYVYTDDIYGEWSDPIHVDQEGIDPSLFFEDNDCYFISNGGDEQGSCIIMSRIDIATGKILEKARCLWRGTGGRFMEAPHLYKFGEYYYVLDAEGGTEYGHMVNYARSKSLWGPYEPYPGNPVLTNRNLGGYVLQGAGHGDLLEDRDGKWWFVHLAFRQQGMWAAYHHLGREVCLVPVEWQDGWFVMGDGASRLAYELSDRRDIRQERAYVKTMQSLTRDHEWCFLRKRGKERYRFPEGYEACANGNLTIPETADEPTLRIVGCAEGLSETGEHAMVCVRQCEMEEEFSCLVESACEEAGITVYMDERHHYDLFLRGDGKAVLRFTVGPASEEIAVCDIPLLTESGNADPGARLTIRAEAYQYRFYCNDRCMGQADTKHLSTEVAGGFTGVVYGMYAVDDSGGEAQFSRLRITHESI